MVSEPWWLKGKIITFAIVRQDRKNYQTELITKDDISRKYCIIKPIISKSRIISILQIGQYYNVCQELLEKIIKEVKKEEIKIEIYELTILNELQRDIIVCTCYKDKDGSAIIYFDLVESDLWWDSDEDIDNEEWDSESIESKNEDE